VMKEEFDRSPTIFRLTHSVLVVNIDGVEYLADGGFGFSSPRSPMLFCEGVYEQHGEKYSLGLTDIYDDGNEWMELCIEVKGEWMIMYHILLTERTDEDVNEDHYQLFMNPSKIGVRDVYMIIGKVFETDRRGLVFFKDTDHVLYKIIRSDVPSEETKIYTWDEFVEIGRSVFGVVIPEDVKSMIPIFQ